MLLEDGGDVGLGHVVGEGAVAEDHGALARWGQRLVPVHDAEGQRLDFLSGDLRGEADEQRAGADAVDGLASEGLLLDGHGQVEAELEEQLEEDIRLGAVGLEVLDRFFERLREVLAVRFPRPNVTGGQLEDAEAEVAGKQRVLFPNLLAGTAQAFFGQFGDGAGFAEFVAIF